MSGTYRNLRAAAISVALLSSTTATLAATACEPDDPDELAAQAALQPEQTLGLTTATWDPWGPFNRRIYDFNARFDETVHLPAANMYRQAVPGPGRTAVGNFFRNLGEIGNVVNHVLQGRIRTAGRSTGRLLINTTVGLGGLIDVASDAGLQHTPTTFGTTLGRWGVGPGPYLVLPVLGPSSLRDGVGLLADFGLDRGIDVGGLFTGREAVGTGVAFAVDERSRVAFRYYQTASPFEYELIRFLHTRLRALEVGAVRPAHDADTQDCTPAALLQERGRDRVVVVEPQVPL